MGMSGEEALQWIIAGCYAHIHGYHTQVFEMHDKPGGYCTAWKRKGYAVDGCIHHLAGIDVPEERFSGLGRAGRRFKTSVREADADSCQPKGGTQWTES